MSLDRGLSKHLETIGALSEAVAHDINNLLSGVLGYSELLLEETPSDHLKPFIEEILKAGKRISSLTRLLLLFRKSEYKAEHLDINELITELQRYIPTVIGSNALFATSLQPELWAVEADPTYIQRMILLITATVRETMSGPGQFALETKNIPVPGNPADPVILDPGRYVRIAAEASAKNSFTHVETKKEEILENSDLCEVVRLCCGHLRGRRSGNELAIRVYLPAANASF